MNTMISTFNDILKDTYTRSMQVWGRRFDEWWPWEPPKSGARRILERWCECGGKVVANTSLKKPHHKLCAECLSLRVLAGTIQERKQVQFKTMTGRIKLDARLFAKPDQHVDAVSHDEGAPSGGLDPEVWW